MDYSNYINQCEQSIHWRCNDGHRLTTVSIVLFIILEPQIAFEDPMSGDICNNLDMVSSLNIRDEVMITYFNEMSDFKIKVQFP